MSSQEQFHRGLDQYKFIPKGQWITGVNVSFSQGSYDDFQFFIVDDVCLIVVGGKSNIAFFLFGRKVWYVPRVQMLQGVCCNVVVPYRVQKVYEYGVVLSVNMFQFYGNEVRVLQHFA